LDIRKVGHDRPGEYRRHRPAGTRCEHPSSACCTGAGLMYKVHLRQPCDPCPRIHECAAGDGCSSLQEDRCIRTIG